MSKIVEGARRTYKGVVVVRYRGTWMLAHENSDSVLGQLRAHNLPRYSTLEEFHRAVRLAGWQQ